jgi:hypothetical protein
MGDERVTPGNIADLLSRMQGEVATVHYFRRDRLMSCRLPTDSRLNDTCALWLLPDEEVAPDVLAWRNAWLATNRSSVD